MAAYGGQNTYAGNAATGIFKDINDALYEIEGNDTVIMDNARSVMAKDKRHYWEELKFSMVTSNTEQRSEGATLSGDTPPTQTERSNYTEINSETYLASSTALAVAKRGGKAGVKDYYRTLRDQAVIELKGKVERSLLKGAADSGDNGTVPVARCMDGLVEMGKDIGTTGYNTNVSGGETNFRALLASMRAAGGLRRKRRVLLTSWNNKDLIGKNWTGISTVTQAVASDATIQGDVRIYVSQFGPIALQGHDSFATNTEMVIGEWEGVAVAWLENTVDEMLAKTALGISFDVHCENTLEYDKPSTLGYYLIS